MSPFVDNFRITHSSDTETLARHDWAIAFTGSGCY